MFAYVFWHTLKTGLPAADYERGLTAFGKALMGCGCLGLKSTASFSISAVPWLDGQAGYEGYYVDRPVNHLGDHGKSKIAEERKDPQGIRIRKARRKKTQACEDRQQSSPPGDQFVHFMFQRARH